MNTKSPASAKRGLRAMAWKVLKYAVLALLVYILWAGYRIYSVGHSDSGGNADCAVVLGAAAYHKNPSPVFAARLDHAIGLYREGRVKALVITGGRGSGAFFAESEVGRLYCIENRVPEKDIFIETISLTTHENITQAKNVMETQGYANALLVSDPWHLRRAQLMAEDIGVSSQCSATLTSKYESFGAKASFFFKELFNVQVYHLFGE